MREENNNTNRPIIHKRKYQRKHLCIFTINVWRSAGTSTSYQLVCGGDNMVVCKWWRKIRILLSCFGDSNDQNSWGENSAYYDSNLSNKYLGNVAPALTLLRYKFQFWSVWNIKKAYLANIRCNICDESSIEILIFIKSEPYPQYPGSSFILLARKQIWCQLTGSRSQLTAIRFFIFCNKINIFLYFSPCQFNTLQSFVPM